MPVIDLKSLQEKAAPFFEEWKIAVSKNDARECRKSIYHAVTASILNHDLDAKGIYCFVRLANPEGLCRIKYIGIVSRGAHTLKKRMWDHLAKEYSSLRPELLNISEQEAEQSIRLLIATLHKGHVVDKYTKNHLKGRRMSLSDSIFFYRTPAANPHLIEEAETALIHAARPGPGELHKLINSKKIKGRKKISKEATSLAHQAIVAWVAEGIGEITGLEWHSRLTQCETHSR
ncbi:MAG: hypothetical protein R3E04_11465 [Sphingobium sp.]